MSSFNIHFTWLVRESELWEKFKEFSHGIGFGEQLRRLALRWIEQQQAIRDGKPVGPVKSMDMRDATDEINQYSSEDCDIQYNRISAVLMSIKQRSNNLHKISLNDRIVATTKSDIIRTTTMPDDTDEEVAEDEEVL